MAKAPITIYVRELRDACAYTDENWAVCGLPRKQHGCFTPEHNFEALPSRFVYPTNAERREIFEQLKEEFDG